jgi:hypothetical protein
VVLAAGCGGTASNSPPVDTHEATNSSAAPTPTDSAAESAAPTSGKKCTQNQCVDQFTIKMKWQPSDPKLWSIEVGIDGKKSTCSFDWSPTSTTADCNGGLVLAFQNPPIEDHVTILVQVPGAPESIEYTVLHQGKPVKPTRTYTPTYETIQPNGPACAPSCKQASGPFVLK